MFERRIDCYVSTIYLADCSNFSLSMIEACWGNNDLLANLPINILFNSKG